MKQKDLLLPKDRFDYFWALGGLLCVLLISIMARDINRPFTGLHSWGQAHEPWIARVHVKYGLGYTKGLMTWAVGDPPTPNPSRYLDHPQLPLLTDAAFMLVLGVNHWALRAVNISMTVVTLLIFLKIVRALFDDKTALLAGLLFAIAPLNGYFGVGTWLYPLAFLAIWCYLVLIRALHAGPQPTKWHEFGLAAGLFFALQMSWEGFFFALALGVHYVLRCVRKRQLDIKLLAILAVAPLSSLALDFLVLAAARGWDVQSLIEIYKWRAGGAEVGKHDWSKWFATLWEYAVTNFSLPVMIITIAYFTVGQLSVWTTKDPQLGQPLRRFSQFWLLVMPAVFQLLILKGCLWKHQTWERPFLLVVPVAGALGILLLADLLTKVRPVLAKVSTAALIAVSTIACVRDLNHYYSISHFSPAKVKLFTKLNEFIPPDKALLGTVLPAEGLIVNQHKAKGTHYRPEVAWYLDREIVQARTFEGIQEKTKTGRFSYYLVPALPDLNPLINQLRKHYKYEYFPADLGGPGKAPMLPYLLFDLQSGPPRP
jgi:hypothetical protein